MIWLAPLLIGLVALLMRAFLRDIDRAYTEEAQRELLAEQAGDRDDDRDIPANLNI